MDLAAYNIESWKHIISFYEDLTAQLGWEALEPLLELVKAVSQSDRAKQFQAGQSIYNLIISTVDYYGLEDEDHFVIVEPMNPDFQRFQITYRTHLRSFESAVCEPNSLLSTLEPILDLLWSNTRGRDISRSATNNQ